MTFSARGRRGSRATRDRSQRRPIERGVRIGAHVGYRDLAGFGRRELHVDPRQLRDEVAYQIAALDGIARAAATSVSYVKARGALCNPAARDEAHAGALIDRILAYRADLPALGLPDSVLLDLAERAGLLAGERRGSGSGRRMPCHARLAPYGAVFAYVPCRHADT